MTNHPPLAFFDKSGPQFNLPHLSASEHAVMQCKAQVLATSSEPFQPSQLRRSKIWTTPLWGARGVELDNRRPGCYSYTSGLFT